jgi:trehalose 6-phosphate synthase
VSRLRRSLNGEKLAIGVDRLDYSKGLSTASRRSTACGPAAVACAHRVIAADRDAVARRNRGLWKSAERAGKLVSDVNGRHGEVDWTPIRYLNKGFSQTVLAGSIARPRSAW